MPECYCPKCNEVLIYVDSDGGTNATCPSCENEFVLPDQEYEEGPYKGPPYCCSYCGGDLKKAREASNTSGGLFLIIIGILLIPLCVGIFILLYGLNEGSKCNFWWECEYCEQRFPRKREMFEIG